MHEGRHRMRLLTANNIEDEDDDENEDDRRGAGSILANEEVIRIEAKRAIRWVKAFFCFSFIGISRPSPSNFQSFSSSFSIFDRRSLTEVCAEQRHARRTPPDAFTHCQ
jgi:hypothetical protein